MNVAYSTDRSGCGFDWLGILLSSAALLVLWRTYAYNDLTEIKDWVISSDRAVYRNIFQIIQDDGFSVAISQTAGIEFGFFIVNLIFIYVPGGFEALILANEFLLLIALSALSFEIAGARPNSTIKIALITVLILGVFIILTPFFQSYSNNIIRQSFSFSICIFALVALFRGNFWWCGILWLVAASIHIPTAIFCTAFLCAFWLVSNVKVSRGLVFLAFVLSLFLYAVGFMESFFLIAATHVGIFFPKVQNFVNDGQQYAVGFKWKFAAVSLVGLAGCVGSYLNWRRDCSAVVCTAFVILSVTYMLMSGMAFYDRIALLSWFLIPVLYVHISALLLRGFFR